MFIFENRYHVHFQVVTFPHWKREMDKVSSLVPWEGDLRWSWCIGGLGANLSCPTCPEWKGRGRQREKDSVRQYFLSLFLTVLGLCWCAQAFSSYCEQGLHSSCGVPASHCGDFPCGRAWAPGLTGFTNCGALASRPCSIWDLPGPGIDPVSPPSAGRLLTTGAPRKSFDAVLTEPCGKFWRQTHPSELPRIKAGGPGL